jgi:hypothetical protein
MRRRRLWLCAAPAALALLDNGLTLWGQPPEYWAGDTTKTSELSPAMTWFLRQHVLGGVVETVLWVAAVSLLIIVLPDLAAKVLALAVALGHATGAGSWLVRGPETYWIYPVLFLTSATLIVWTWRLADASGPKPRPNDAAGPIAR